MLDTCRPEDGAQLLRVDSGRICCVPHIHSHGTYSRPSRGGAASSESHGDCEREKKRFLHTENDDALGGVGWRCSANYRSYPTLSTPKLAMPSGEFVRS